MRGPYFLRSKRKSDKNEKEVIIPAERLDELKKNLQLNTIIVITIITAAFYYTHRAKEYSKGINILIIGAVYLGALLLRYTQIMYTYNKDTKNKNTV